MSKTLETVGTILVILVPLTGALLWVIHSIIAPLKVVIENNTTALDRIMDRLDSHGEKIEDHGIRIACIETRHEVEMGN